jgi:protein SCO1/2
MTDRTSRLLVLLTAFVAGLGVSLGLIFFLVGTGPAVPPPAAIGGPFQLVDQDSRPITDESLKGKPTLVFFGYTHCPDVCPTTLFEVSQIFQALGKDGDRLNALFVTVDPERDTPAVLKDYLSSFDPHLKAASGTPQQIESALKTYRVYAKKVPSDDGAYTMDHTSIVYLMDKNGRFVAPFNLQRKPPELAADVRRYL